MTATAIKSIHNQSPKNYKKLNAIRFNNLVFLNSVNTLSRMKFRCMNRRHLDGETLD